MKGIYKLGKQFKLEIEQYYITGQSLMNIQPSSYTYCRTQTF